MKKPKVSKSAFMLGTQCLKAIHMHYYNAQLKKPLDVAQQAIVDKGIEVGLIARGLFPGGLDLSQGGNVMMPDLLSATAKAMSEKTNGVFYEAAFASKDLGWRFQADIFVELDEVSKLIEVKSSTNIKEEHILDLSFQYYVLRASGYQKPVECYIAHLNGSYIRQGDVIIDELFTIENVTEQILSNQERIKYYTSRIESTLIEPQAPNIEISENCHKPYECPFYDHCHKDVPDLSVFDIGRLRKKKAYEFYHNGIVELTDIQKDTQLSDKQWIEIDSGVNQTTHVDHKELKNFLAGLNEPLHFMDFESFMGIAKFENTRVYQQICFQYCVMSRLKRDGEVIQKDFLADHSVDPRKQFIERLLEDTKEKGDIIVYNKLFEIGRMRELAEQFPEFENEIGQRIARIKDLMIPFGKRWFYSHEQKGSHSIKAVLPVLVPSLSYSDLEINNGALASVMYEQLDRYPEKKQNEIRNALLIYCGLDVRAMIEILDALRKIK